MEMSREVLEEVFDSVRGAGSPPDAVFGALAFLADPNDVKHVVANWRREPSTRWQLLALTGTHFVQIIWESADEDVNFDNARTAKAGEGGTFLRSTWCQPLSAISKLQIREVTPPNRTDPWDKSYDVALSVHFDNGDVADFPDPADLTASHEKDRVDKMISALVVEFTGRHGAMHS